MSGNFSRYARQRDKLYSRVPQLQGAMVTDSDQREREEVAAALVEGTGDLAIGTGIPAVGGILDYATQAGPPDIVSAAALKPGRVMADGLWAEVRARGPVSGALSLVSNQQDLLVAGEVPASGRFLVYVDVWDRHVGAAEDPRLVDPAFLGAETSVRRQRMGQVKLAAVSGFAGADDRLFVEDGLPPFGDLRLTGAEITGTTPVEDPCDPCAAVIEAGTESGNALFRLEVHDSPYRVAAPSGAAAEPVPPAAGNRRIMLKFSRDNGSIEVPGNAVQSLIDDPALVDFVFEITDLGAEQVTGLDTRPGVAREALLVDLAGLETQAQAGLGGRIVRVWDGAVSIDPTNATLDPQPVGAHTLTGEIDTSGGTWRLGLEMPELSLTLEAETRGSGLPFVLPGDAWTVELREFADETGAQVAFVPEPVEMVHRYAFVGRVQNRALLPETATSDFRSRHFPALTALDAQSVAWSNHHHPEVETDTVQGAIDLLWAREPVEGGDCLCTFCIDPEAPLHEQLAKIAEFLKAAEDEAPGTNRFSARICLPRGHYRLESAVSLDGLGHLAFVGAGRDATEVVMADGAVMKLSGCAAVDLADLSLVSEDKTGSDLIIVSDCDRVDVRRCLIGAGAAPAGQGGAPALLRVEMPASEASGVWITDNVFAIGVNRAALWLMGGSLQVVENNLVTGPGRPSILGAKVFVPEILDKISYGPVPADIRPGAASGYFLVPGTDDQALDLTDFPVSERAEIFDFVAKSSDLLTAGGLKTPDLWDQYKSTVTAGGVALETRDGSVAGLRDSVVETPVRDGETPARDTSTPVRDTGLTLPVRGTDGRLDSVVLGNAGLTRTGSTGRLFEAEARTVPFRTAVSPTLDAILSQPDVVGVDLRDVELPNLTDDLWSDLKGMFDDFQANVDVVSFRRAFGMVVTVPARGRATLRNNRFDWVHSAIVLSGPYQQSNSRVMPAVGQVEIAGNQVLRVPIKDESQAILLDALYPAAITCDGAGSLTLADNQVRQLIRTDEEADDYVGKYLDAGQATMPRDEGFAAIELRGALGPVLQAVGNEASYFRHAICVTGRPAWVPNSGTDVPATARSTVWTFRRNVVLPALAPAVILLVKTGGVRVIPASGAAERGDDDNHPPMT